MARGYKDKMIDTKIMEVTSMSREDTLMYRKLKDNNKKRVPLVINYHPRLRFLGKILAKHFHLLQGNERLKAAFPEPPMAAFKKLRNIKAYLNSNEDKLTKTGNNKCGSTKGCLCCRHLQETNKFKIGDKIHSTDRGGTCGSEDLIYAMECTKCSIWYIGETGDSLRGRLNGHRSVTKKIINGGSVDESKNDCGAPLHFGQKDHDLERDMRLYILDQGKWGSMRERRLKESYYIAKYKTLSPHGMNKYAGPLTDFYEIV